MARLSRVVAALTDGQPRWLLLLGPRKIGKTSLLLEWVRRGAGTGLRWVHLDLFRDPPGAELFRRYALRVLDAALRPEIGISLEALSGEAAAFRSALVGSALARGLSSEDLAWLLAIPEARVDERFAERALELPERLARSMDLRLVVILDEFQEMLGSARSPLSGDVARRLRGVWQLHRCCAYVVSGSAQHTLQQLCSSGRSAFFGAFDMLRLGPLPEDAAATLLERCAGRPLSDEARAMVLQVVGGNPFYLHAIGDALHDGLDATSEVDPGETKEAIQRVLFSSDGRLALHFEATFHELVGRSGGLGETLFAVAGGPARLGEIARHIGAASGATVSYLRRLGEAVVKEEDGRYRLADPVFGTWLRWREPGGTTVPMTLVGNEGEQRVAVALAQRGFELVYVSRASRGAFDLLALRGPVQLALQVRHRPFPLRFTRAEWERMEAEAGRRGWLWVVAQVGEEVAFLDPARVTSGKECRLGLEARIENLPRWVDERMAAEVGRL